MGRIRGFLIKHRVSMLIRRVFRGRGGSSYHRLDAPQGTRVKSLSRLISWTRRLRTRAKAVLTRNSFPGRGYTRVGHDPSPAKSFSVPKGHTTVYVGPKDGELEKILVPVVYLNHPLFVDLLKESEKEYGFNYPGGITIPCRISDFEMIRSRIHAVRCTRLDWTRTSTDSRITIL